MASATTSPELLAVLQNRATQLRIESVRATSEAGSGHPSSCCSAADIVAALFSPSCDTTLKILKHSIVIDSCCQKAMPHLCSMLLGPKPVSFPRATCSSSEH